jgi:hypothetical protein
MNRAKPIHFYCFKKNRYTGVLKIAFSSLDFNFKILNQQALCIAFTPINAGFKLVVSLASPEFTEGSR